MFYTFFTTIFLFFAYTRQIYTENENEDFVIARANITAPDRNCITIHETNFNFIRVFFIFCLRIKRKT